jgi:hypothetical protein
MGRSRAGGSNGHRVWRALGWTASCVFALTSACTATATGGGGDGGTATSAATMRVAGVTAAQPRNWRADGRGWGIELRWSALADDIDHYVVVRDGSVLDDGVDTTSFLDRGALPGARYTYGIVGVDAQSRRTRPGRITVRTGHPPRSFGHLDGAFLTRLHLVRVHGLAADPSGGVFTFIFHPACHRGPCAVLWRVGERHTSGRLGWRHGAYVGVVNGPFQIRSCTGATVDERLRVLVRVSASSVVGSGWRGTRIRGVVMERSHEPGCAAASITWRLRGALQT